MAAELKTNSMPGKSKKGGGLESSPVYDKQKFGAPFKMNGFSGFGEGTNSPLSKLDLIEKGKKLAKKVWKGLKNPDVKLHKKYAKGKKKWWE